MLLNKTLLLSKFKKNIEFFNEILKTYKDFEKTTIVLEEKIDFLSNQNKNQESEIESLKSKCGTLENDILQLAHSINVLNYVLEAAILNSDEFLNFKKNIKYH